MSGVTFLVLADQLLEGQSGLQHDGLVAWQDLLLDAVVEVSDLYRVWLLVVVFGCVWLCWVACGCVWLRVVVCSCVWVRVVICGCDQFCVVRGVVSGCVWLCVVACSYAWTDVINGFI